MTRLEPPGEESSEALRRTGERPRESARETIESIVIALILAFVFRAFVVEAFVIPTGSMAPTLYGAHGTLVCQDCGTEFAYGLRDLGDMRNMPQVASHSVAVCPNCNHQNTHLKYSDEKRNPETGDRILVLKWPYDIGGTRLGPHRWDVTVFKDPADGTTNFIKRMVGLPDEVLMIVDGDVFAVPAGELSSTTLQELDAIRHEKFEYQVGIRQSGQLRAPSRAVFAELERKLRIARKSPEAQESLWSLVYNHNYPPQQLDSNQPRWSAGMSSESGWDPATRVVKFRNRSNPGDYIALSGKPMLSFNAYNVNSRIPPPVSDQRVRFVVTPASASAFVQVRLEKHGRVFWGSFHFDGSASITESAEQPPPHATATLFAATTPPPLGTPLEFEFENVDYRLALRIDGREVLASSDAPDDPSFYGPDIKALRGLRRPPQAVPPRLYGSGGDFDVTHLIVDRDVYYYHDPNMQALALTWAPRGGWGTDDSPILLRGHEYFMLGDNTSASKDSRLWDVWGPHLRDRGEAFQLGTVPEDQLIGKAFFVYWPSPLKPDWLSWFPIGVVPDVGKMRWIR